MHSRKFEKEFRHKCPMLGCKSTFPYSYNLNMHLRIHDNDLSVCSYCPYRYVESSKYMRHLKNHFGIKDFECDQCGKLFRSIGQLNMHYETHEGIIYCCLLCDNYEASIRSTIRFHLHQRHKDIVGSVGNWDHIQKFIKINK